MDAAEARSERRVAPGSAPRYANAVPSLKRLVPALCFVVACSGSAAVIPDPPDDGGASTDSAAPPPTPTGSGAPDAAPPPADAAPAADASPTADASPPDAAPVDATVDSPSDASPVDGSADASADATPDGATAGGCQKMDIVLVVDDSASMGSKQMLLSGTHAATIDTLNAFRTRSGGLLDYRIGVTSTDTFRASLASGGQGGFVTTPATACLAGPSRAWLERTDANTAAALSCRASLGISGSGTERPLEALRLALTTRQADQNAGFLRDDALLAFLIVTDEDDSSAVTPSALVAALDTLKKRRGRWAGAIMAGPGGGPCGGGTGGGGADAAPRLAQFVADSEDLATGSNNVIWRTICQAPFDTPVRDAVSNFTRACLAMPPLPP